MAAPVPSAIDPVSPFDGHKQSGFRLGLGPESIGLYMHIAST
jgi:hypothetical protein